jgi:hypothetical protein
MSATWSPVLAGWKAWLLCAGENLCVGRRGAGAVLVAAAGGISLCVEAGSWDGEGGKNLGTASCFAEQDELGRVAIF